LVLVWYLADDSLYGAYQISYSKVQLQILCGVKIKDKKVINVEERFIDENYRN
jgi:hypothetical protein